jgi:topoisomerase-4 subunit A
MPSSRAKTNNLDIAFNDYLIKNASAKGKRVSNRVIRRVSLINGITPEQTKQNLPLPGLDLLQEKNDLEIKSNLSDKEEETND